MQSHFGVVFWLHIWLGVIGMQKKKKKKARLDSTYGQAQTTSNFHRQSSAKEMVKSERAISLQKGLKV